ncbi:MAG TPA: class I SAM-dependent methyltransferase [Streptosporangiaceae bacterium]|jgi:predicted O-methyltransferase YrrM
MDALPPLVQQAYAAARRVGFPLTTAESTGTGAACLPDTGRFLAMLAAGCWRIGELGTGTGVGTAWMASAMPAECTLVTAEIDEERAAAARELFADDLRVTVVTGDALDTVSLGGPYDLLFSDCKGDRQTLVDLLTIGGRLVMDDVTPAQLLPDDSQFRTNDPKREFFFANPRLASAEVILPDLRNALLVGTRTA